jgi:hypothetical protein
VTAPILVFAGPSLPAATRPEGPFEWRPPATAGDLLACLERKPARVCLIDGLFDAVPAPWHKELLLLMAGGTLLFGASSMGALRAAELYRFGMIGVGAIYRAYRDGRITGDDEVALIHATGALDWAPLTVPMVEVRATLSTACRARVIDVATARGIRAAVRDIYFGERDWPLMQKACIAERLVDGATFDRIAAMHVPLKRQDAMACLAVARDWSKPPRLCPPPPSTIFIRRLAEEVTARGPA